MPLGSCVRVAALVALVGGAAAAFPAGTEAALQTIADAKSAKYNCSISVSVFDGHTNVKVIAGVSDFASGRKATVDDKYVWGSGTKPLTGVSILKLVSEGKFGLDDLLSPLVDPYLAEMAAHNPKQKFRKLADLWGAGNMSNVTVRMCLTMNSGIPDFDTAVEGTHQDPLRAEYFKDPSKNLSPIQLMELPWVAGNWSGTGDDSPNGGYSSTNFMLLGLIVARFAGAPSWQDAEQGSVIPEPLRTKFQFGVTGAPSNYTAVHGYDRTSYNMPVNTTNDQDVYNVDGVFGGWTAADMVASPGDVAELYWAIYGPNPTIAPNSNTIMPAMFKPSKGHRHGAWYGIATFNLGYYTGHRSDGKYGHAWGHIGATYGFDSIVAYFPTLNFVMSMSSNLENDDQTHPSEVVCFGYTAVANLMLGSHAKCTYDDAGYYGPSCKCDNFTASVDTTASLVV